jgi:hypothetical protein
LFDRFVADSESEVHDAEADNAARDAYDPLQPQARTAIEIFAHQTHSPRNSYGAVLKQVLYRERTMLYTSGNI